jgi:dolichol-phosphate mannosyltransferase
MPNIASDTSVTVLMPTYNEAENILPLIDETLTTLESHYSRDLIDILVIDDNSPDGTWRLVQSHRDPRVKVIRRMSDRGLRNSIWEGIRQAKGEIAVWLDCDFSHPPRYVPQIIDSVMSGWDIAVNSRFVPGAEDIRTGKGATLQRFLSWFLSLITWITLRQNFRDYTSGFIALRTNIVRELGLHGDYGEFFIDFIYRAIKKGYRVTELPYKNEPRRAGESKTATNPLDFFIRGSKYIATLFQLKMKTIKV